MREANQTRQLSFTADVSDPKRRSAWSGSKSECKSHQGEKKLAITAITHKRPSALYNHIISLPERNIWSEYSCEYPHSLPLPSFLLFEIHILAWKKIHILAEEKQSKTKHQAKTEKLERNKQTKEGLGMLWYASYWNCHPKESCCPFEKQIFLPAYGLNQENSVILHCIGRITQMLFLFLKVNSIQLTPKYHTHPGRCGTDSWGVCWLSTPVHSVNTTDCSTCKSSPKYNYVSPTFNNYFPFFHLLA